MLWARLSSRFFFDVIISFPSSFPFSCVSFSEFSLVSFSSASCSCLSDLHGMILFVSAFVLILFASAFVHILVLPEGPWIWTVSSWFCVRRAVSRNVALFITNSACLHLPVVPQSARCLSSATHLDFYTKFGTTSDRTRRMQETESELINQTPATDSHDPGPAARLRVSPTFGCRSLSLFWWIDPVLPLNHQC